MKRPKVLAFWDYKDRINKEIRTFFKNDSCIRAFTRARLTCIFRIAGHPRMDLGNLVKSVEDSIVPLLIQDDDLKHIPEYGKMRGELICDTCGSKRIKRNGSLADDCKDIQNCPWNETIITMEEIK